MLARVGKKDPALDEDTMRFIMKTSIGFLLTINVFLRMRFVPMEKTCI